MTLISTIKAATVAAGIVVFLAVGTTLEQEAQQLKHMKLTAMSPEERTAVNLPPVQAQVQVHTHDNGNSSSSSSSSSSPLSQAPLEEEFRKEVDSRGNNTRSEPTQAPWEEKFRIHSHDNSSSSPLQAPREEEFRIRDYRLCRIQPDPIVNERPVLMKGLGMNLTYQCSGNAYNRFANLLEQVIRGAAADRPQWGKHEAILPGLMNNAANKKKNHAILIMGNSHTRQLASALLCQYKDQVIDTKFLYSMPKYPQNGVLKIEMKHNLTVYSATNVPFVYSHQWYKILEDSVLKRKLSTLDAIVMGRFNSYSESTGTNFYKMMMEYQQQFPELNMDFEKIPGPVIKHVAAYFKGPIIYVSMFAKYGVPRYIQAEKQIEAIQNVSQRTNLKLVDGRQYIAAMETTQGTLGKQLPIHECSTEDRRKVGTCITNVTSHRFSNGHRCMGNRGGHPDLVAWDVVEALHHML